MNKNPQNKEEFLTLISDLFYKAKIDGNINYGGGMTYGAKETFLTIYMNGKSFTINAENIIVK